MQTIGAAATKDLLFTGRLIDADEAHHLRLIDRLVEEGGALDAAKALAEEIAGTSQWSTRATKTMINMVESGLSDDDEAAKALFLEAYQGVDFKEGYKAFMEKRPAKFPFK